MTFNIYVISYHRSDTILTEKLLDYCTYVVRKSEEEAYKSAGVQSVWGIEDNLINSFQKVVNYLLDNAPEDVICIMDDDIKKFMYRYETMDEIKDGSIVTMELERLAQIMVDLGIGYGATPLESSLKYYDKPFKFTGLTGQVRIFNRPVYRAKVGEEWKFLCEIDLVLQELLINRVILIPMYLVHDVIMDTNAGGANINKSIAQFRAEDEVMKLRWGKYYIRAGDSKKGRLNVKR